MTDITYSTIVPNALCLDHRFALVFSAEMTCLGASDTFGRIVSKAVTSSLRLSYCIFRCALCESGTVLHTELAANSWIRERSLLEGVAAASCPAAMPYAIFSEALSLCV